jgi:hypothetical protein
VFVTVSARDLADGGKGISLTPDGGLVFRGKNKQGDVEYVREL